MLKSVILSCHVVGFISSKNNDQSMQREPVHDMAGSVAACCYGHSSLELRNGQGTWDGTSMKLGMAQD